MSRYRHTPQVRARGITTGELSTNKYCHAAVAAVVVDGTGLRS